MRFSLVITTLVATVLPIWAGEFTSTLTVTGDWTGRMEAHFTFPLTEDLIGWEAILTFSAPVDGMNPMAGQVYESSSDKKTWTLVNKPDKPYEAKGSFELMFYGDYSGSSAPSATAVLKNMGIDDYTVQPVPFSGNLKYNYADVLHKSILFYEAQRSGKLPDDNRIPWRGDSAVDDHGDGGVDLSGGWYDAGDHIKFNFPMAYTTTVLAWSYIEWEDAYKDAGEADWLLDCIKWPLDYLLKCHTGKNELYVQVGDAGPDHSYWGAPETMTMDRPAYKVTASAPGSDVVFETAAAMAAGSMAFKSKDPSYAATLLDHAKELWEFGHAHEGKYSDSVQAAAGFYRSNNYTDETCWGSNWLYRATKDQKYLDEAEKQFDPDPAWGQSWDEKTIGNQVLLYLNTQKDKYKQAVINTYKGWFPGGGEVEYSPKGLAFRLQWGSLRYSSNMAMAALYAADLGINPEEYRHWAMCQIHYALGDTGFSYLIGFGDSYPQSPHHRSSSCPNLPAPCGSGIMSGTQRNVHTLYGALVGGPGPNDDYTDSRTNYVNNEVACDYNAGFQAAVAALYSAYLKGDHPEQTGSSVCPYS